MPQTILYLTPSSRLLGARRSLLQLVTHLDPERFRPVVVAQRQGDLVNALRDAGVKVHLLFQGWWRKGIYWPLIPFCTARLAALARRENAALIHCNEFHSNPYAIVASWISRRLLSKSLPVATHMRLSITPRQIDKYLLRKANRILAVSEAAARDFDVWPDRAQRVQVVYNGVDLDEFHSAIDPLEARRRLGFSPDDFVVGQFGLLSPRKQQHVLIESARRTAAVLPHLKVLIVGSAGRTEQAYERQIKKQAADLNLGAMVRFIPFTPRVVDIYAACDVNVLISNDEGFGRTIIEAGAMAIPSIGTRIGGIPELIEDAKSGYLLHPEGLEAALSEKIILLAQNKSILREMGRNARILVERKFSIQCHAAQMMDVYEHILAGRQCPTG